MIEKIDKNSLNIYDELFIDIFKLEEEWLKQSSVYMRYMDEAIEAEDLKKNFQIELNRIEAEIDLSIREEFQKDGKKFTEKVVENVMKIQKKYSEIHEKNNILNYNLNIRNACVKALEMKKTALENLEKLYLAGYYSEPSLKKKSEEISEKLRNKLNKKLEKI